MEVTNILGTKLYKMTEGEKVPVVKNLLPWEDLQFMQTFIHEEKEKCKPMKELLTLLCSKYKPQQYRIVISLQYQILHRKSNEFA